MKGGCGNNAIGGFQPVLAAKLARHPRQFDVNGYHEQRIKELFYPILFCGTQPGTALQLYHRDGRDIQRRCLIENGLQQMESLRITAQVVDNGVGVERIHEELTRQSGLIPCSAAPLNVRDNLRRGLLPDRLDTPPQSAPFFRCHERMHFREAVFLRVVCRVCHAD